MDKKFDPMDKFNFLLGTWEMKYDVPKSKFSAADKGTGIGEFKRILNDKYVAFDYHAKFTKSEGGAHGIFGWDEKSNIYRYWWFENSGAFMEASCNFTNDNTLSMNWHNSTLVQTFTKMKNDKVILQMKTPVNKDDYAVVLEVVFTKK
ncbi:MAG: DUF1579 family protein [Bacteroidota bacterium]